MFNKEQNNSSEDFSEGSINLFYKEYRRDIIPLKEEKTTAADKVLLSKKHKNKNNKEAESKKEEIVANSCEKATQTINEYDNDSDSEQELYRQYLLTQKK